MDIRETLAANVRVLMVERGYLSQADLARAAGISFTHMSVILRGMKYATTDMLERLAAALEVEPWMLILDDVSERLPAAGRLADVVVGYLNSDADGQATILRVAESQASFRHP